MNNESKKIKVNKQDKFLTKVKASDDKTEYDFKVEAGDANFSELKSDNKPTSKTFKLKAKKSTDNDEPSNWKDVTTDEKTVYEKGWIKEGIYIKGKKFKIDGTEVEFKNEVHERLSTDIHSFTYTFYGLSVALTFVLLLGGYYLFSSKEDKEEESL